MDRRRLMIAAVGSWVVVPAFAHHGWSSFDTDRPLYLEGRAAAVRWRNPHVEVELDVKPDLKLPADLSTLPLPAQSAQVDGSAVLKKTALPQRRDKRWELELAPLTRMESWRVKEIQPGATLAVIGYTMPGEKGDAVLRVEYLFIDQQAYGLRSSPA